jgi:hypothetical protein
MLPCVLLGACHSLTLVDLAEHHNTRELGLRVVRNLRVESEDAHATTILGGYILERLLDQHGDLLLCCMYIVPKLIMHNVSSG